MQKKKNVLKMEILNIGTVKSAANTLVMKIVKQKLKKLTQF